MSGMYRCALERTVRHQSARGFKDPSGVARGALNWGVPLMYKLLEARCGGPSIDGLDGTKLRTKEGRINILLGSFPC